MEPPADSGPDREGGSSRRQFIRSLAAISAGLTVAAPLGRATTVTEKSIPKSAPPNTGGVQGLAEINLKVNGNPERLVVDPRVTLLDALRDRLELTGTRRLRCLHRTSRWESSSVVFDSRSHGSGEGDHYYRGLGKG